MTCENIISLLSVAQSYLRRESCHRPTMLCETCWLMLRGQDRRQWKGTYDLYFTHQSSVDTLKVSAGMGCGICRLLWEELKQDGGFDHSPNDDDRPSSSVPVSTASLRVIPTLQDDQYNELYRLDFSLEYGNTRRKRTFVLKHIGEWSAEAIDLVWFVNLHDPSQMECPHLSERQYRIGRTLKKSSCWP